MKTEYEATFYNIDKDKIREKLKKAGAVLLKREYLQKRVTFNLPSEKGRDDNWCRVRNEDNKITMAYKEMVPGKIENQKELELEVDDFENAIKFLEALGCERKAYQENYREMWELDCAEICIDEWPFLDPYVEIEGESEEEVKLASSKLGFDFDKAQFCSVDSFYESAFGVSRLQVKNETPVIKFEMKNPFLGENK